MRALRQIRNTGYIRARGWKPLGPAGERRYFFHPARSGVVLSISRPRPIGRSNFFSPFLYAGCVQGLGDVEEGGNILKG